MTLPSFDQIVNWMHDNQLIMGLVGSAIIGSMPELLPTWRQLPQWLWTWTRDSAKTFLNFRRMSTDPQPQHQNPPIPNQKAELVVTTQIPIQQPPPLPPIEQNTLPKITG